MQHEDCAARRRKGGWRLTGDVLARLGQEVLLRAHWHDAGCRQRGGRGGLQRAGQEHVRAAGLEQREHLHGKAEAHCRQIIEHQYALRSCQEMPAQPAAVKGRQWTWHLQLYKQQLVRVRNEEGPTSLRGVMSRMYCTLLLPWKDTSVRISSSSSAQQPCEAAQWLTNPSHVQGLHSDSAKNPCMCCLPETEAAHNPAAQGVHAR